MKRFVILAVIVLLALPMLFAQGQKASSPYTTITWWHPNSGLAGAATEELINSFNRTVGEELKIRVEAVYQGKANDVLTKLKPILQSKDQRDLPDLAQLDGSAVLDIRDSAQLITVNELAKNEPDYLSKIVEATRNSITYKNNILAMPFNASTILLYYNKDAFAKAGISEPPRTLDNVATIAAKLKQTDDKGRTTFWGIANVPTTYELMVWLGHQNGLTYLTDFENGHTGAPTRVLFDENGTMVNFLTKWQAIYDTGSLANLTSDLNGAFASGQVAMILASTSNLSTIASMVGDRFEVGVANMPMVDENATGGVNVGGGAIWAFDNGKNNQWAIWEFLKFATSAEEQLKWHIATGYFPVNVDTYDLPAFKAHLQENPLFGVASCQLMNSNPKLQGIWVPSSYQIYYAFQSGILKMLEEKQTPQEASKAIAQEINGYLQEYHLMRAR
ncbi:MAG: ABC transporter substrate-binding protein [Spirochaetales bacterium]|nr:ABC transporter substrate-binding protein [Spirochaetales bacterium]